MVRRVLIVDDEPLARKHLAHLMRDHPEVEVVAACRNGKEAVVAIEAHRPDLVFLDVQMPEMDGFGVIETVGPAAMPAVVFVTAYDAYALKAFTVNALDYLVKPFSDERFDQSLAKALRRLRQQQLEGLSEALVGLVHYHQVQRPAPPPLRHLAVQIGDRTRLVETDTIDYIQAEGVYVRLHCGADRYLIRDTIKRLTATLDGDTFLRIHRSTIVRIDRVQELRPLFHGAYELLLKDGTRLKASRSYKEAVRTLFRLRN